MEIKRYNMHYPAYGRYGFKEDPDGLMVYASDAEKLENKIKSLELEIAELRDEIKNMEDSELLRHEYEKEQAERWE